MTQKHTRRDFLQHASCVPLAGFWLGNSSAEESHQRISRWIEAYDHQGTHRTGTIGDNHSAAWLGAEIRKCGVLPVLEPFMLDRVDPLDCFIELGGKRIEGVPLFDAAFTGAAGVRGKLGVFGSDADIGLIELPPNAEYGPNYETMRRNGKHKALVIITKGTTPGLSLINGAFFGHPFGIPALQVSSEYSEWLKQQAQQSAATRVVAQASRVKTTAYNMTAAIRGTRPKLAPLVVMTPRSGWWHCTSERGGGLVCWLEVMRRLTVKKPARTVHFVASSGHELGHLGLDSFIERRPELVKQARAWIHFGANIGAVGATNRLQALDDELETIAADAMTKAGITINDKAKRGVVPFGEAGNIHQGGGRYVSLLCPGSALFHHPADRWPGAVDVAAVARYATAFAGVAAKLASE